MNNLVSDFGLEAGALGILTSAVQFGFISGTLLFAILTIADRFSPSKVFVACAVFGALFNLGTIYPGSSFPSLVIFRFLTGFTLAGIYPVGMKIASDYYKEGLGKSLGFLVGALVLGKGFPHLVKALTADLPWETVIILTSAIAVIGEYYYFLQYQTDPIGSLHQNLILQPYLMSLNIPDFVRRRLVILVICGNYILSGLLFL
ncbi:MFS transporter [Mangrovivirga cuniculi]|uniref:MFS transporter n=1 Tax=Mangrovivirga cuniculi TaxID=2715131 RepID=UPI001FE87597|nr:MFS transporter [Mangrovivirga cuniculi]